MTLAVTVNQSAQIRFFGANLAVTVYLSAWTQGLVLEHSLSLHDKSLTQSMAVFGAILLPSSPCFSVLLQDRLSLDRGVHAFACVLRTYLMVLVS